MSTVRKAILAIVAALALAVPVQSANAFCCGFFDGWGDGGFSIGFNVGGWGHPYWGGYPGYWGGPWGYHRPYYGYGHYPYYGYPIW